MMLSAHDDEYYTDREQPSEGIEVFYGWASTVGRCSWCGKLHKMERRGWYWVTPEGTPIGPFLTAIECLSTPITLLTKGAELMPLTLTFQNGNFVDVYPKSSTGLFTVDLNGKDKRTRVDADTLAYMLSRVSDITCVITRWKAIID